MTGSMISTIVRKAYFTVRQQLRQETEDSGVNPQGTRDQANGVKIDDVDYLCDM